MRRKINPLFSKQSTAKVIKPCPKNQNFETCLNQVLEHIKPYLDKGDFGEGFKFTSINPIFLESMKIISPDLNISMSNMNLKGATNYKLQTAKYVN